MTRAGASKELTTGVAPEQAQDRARPRLAIETARRLIVRGIDRRQKLSKHDKASEAQNSQETQSSGPASKSGVQDKEAQLIAGNVDSESGGTPDASKRVERSSNVEQNPPVKQTKQLFLWRRGRSPVKIPEQSQVKWYKQPRRRRRQPLPAKKEKQAPAQETKQAASKQPKQAPPSKPDQAASNRKGPSHSNSRSERTKQVSQAVTPAKDRSTAEEKKP